MTVILWVSREKYKKILRAVICEMKGYRHLIFMPEEVWGEGEV